MTVGKLLTAVFAILVTISLSHQIKDPNESVLRGFRLPNNTVPLHYDINLRTNIYRGDFVFDGRVQIHIKILEASDTITLQYRQLVIRNIDILDVNGFILQHNVRFTMTHPLEFLDILSQTPLTIDDELIIDISYTGLLRNDGAGFIRSSYINLDTNETVWLASVQFKNTDARHAVPSYDEIKYRSTVRLQIEHHGSFNAVSNTLIEEQIVGDDGFVTTIFATTPPMPINLLTFTISDFAYTSVMTEFNVSMSTYAQPEAVARGETEFSLTWGQQVFRYLNNLFVNYTLPKLDQIAVPDLEWSTEPSWGLISFRESLLLHTENATPEETTAREVRIAHVFSHNYFGNLVSPVWWTYLWLNEGFATLYGAHVVDNVKGPPNEQYDELMIILRDEMMLADVNEALVPLNQYVESPQEINDKAYDTIVTHYKAAIILFMARCMLKRLAFEKGVNYYLNDRAFDSVTPDDLHIAFQRAYDEDNPGNSVDIAAIMWPWENLRGYPVVTVTIEGDTLAFKQEGFTTSHDELFGIPIVITTSSNPDFSLNFDHVFWMSGREMEISLSNSTIDWRENDWIIVNIRNFAYYITNYDEILWSLIIEALINNPEDIHFEDRGALFTNFYLFIEHAHDVSSTIFLRLAQSLQLENEKTVWNRAHRGLLRIANRLRGTDLFEGHLIYLKTLMTPIYDRLLHDENFNSELTDHVRFWSCASGIQECLDRAIDELFDANIEKTSMCPGFMTANATVLNRFWGEALLDPLNRDQLLNDLACASDFNFLSVYLNASLDLTNILTRVQRELIINRVYSANFVGFDLIRDFVLYNYAFIHAEIMDIGQYLSNIAVFANTITEAEWVSELSALIPPTSGVGRDQIESLLTTNLRWHQRNYDELQEFYNNF